MEVSDETLIVPSEVNRLWVHVSCLSEGNLFTVYHRLLESMIAETSSKTNNFEPPDFEFLLPSNPEWQTKIYYQLVTKQREQKDMPRPSAFIDRPRTAGPWDTTIITFPPTKRVRSCQIQHQLSLRDRTVSSRVAPATWTVKDLSKAGRLLHDPPMETEFDDEQEMRRVYALIYDVFRYKDVLSQTLQSVSFFYLFPELFPYKYLVWLLLFDLYHRRFQDRESSDGSAAAAEKLFPTCDLREPEIALWATRIKLAATMSRMRIANSALKLSDMLPIHLRDGKLIKASHSTVSCWVNKNKIDHTNPEAFFNQIKKFFSLQVLQENTKNLNADQFRWDPLCPMFLTFHNSKRSQLAKSLFIKNHTLILQNRSFCLGPAIFCKILIDHNLTGAVIQTHISSPRATAYLATLLSENDQIFALIVFGAGNRKPEYDKYFKELNLKNVMILPQKFTDIDSESHLIQQVVGVFATPPNSFSAINDPIDLVCSRGGDLAMLQILTDTADTEEGKNRVRCILEEQRSTLRFAMSRPQIQFVLYETHSMINAENDGMVEQVIKEINRAAKYKHAEFMGKISTSAISKTNESELSLSAEILEINNNDPDIELQNESKINITESKSSVEAAVVNLEEILDNLEVPDTDLFEVKELPDLCSNSDQCLKLIKEGCYISLIQRKVVTRFDAKYMIQMAESRGLFGDNNPDIARKQKNANKEVKKERIPNDTIKKRKLGSAEVNRIAAQTHASMMRSCIYYSSSQGSTCLCCPKHHTNETKLPESPARLWWAETINYLNKLKKNLARQKIISTNKDPTKSDKINADIKNIDEVIARVQNTRKTPNIPLFPKLRLTRNDTKIEKVPFPLRVQNVVLPKPREILTSD